ncbi:MAG: inositol monophosphatase family protein [Candidatus Levyibacteriota bacterium]
MTSKSPYLTIALEAVKEAEKVIRKYYSKDTRATLKGDDSPVTIADQEAEEIIKKIIAEKFPDHAFLGEETGISDKNTEYLWIIDPIDGTKHYTRQIPLFATQLALMKGDEVILGVSNAPVMDELIYAEKDRGTFLNGNSVLVSKISEISSSYMSFGGIGYFNKHNLIDSLIKIESDTQGHRGIGDFWSYHLLSSGKIDIMIEAETKVWDIAAVSIIVEEAGGKVTDLKGNSVSRTTNSIVATNGLVHDQVLAYFK